MATPPVPTSTQDDNPWKHLKPRDILTDPNFYKLSKEARRIIASKVWSEFGSANRADQDATLDTDITYWQEYYKTPEPAPAAPAEEGPGFFEKAGNVLKGAFEKLGATQVEAGRAQLEGAREVNKKVADLFTPLPTDMGTPPSIDELQKQVREARQPKGKIAFDPEGADYDYASAKAAGLQADETGHWPSRDPKTGLLLKGRNHPTWQKTLESEAQQGYEIVKGPDGRYYSRPGLVPGTTIKVDWGKALSFDVPSQFKPTSALKATVSTSHEKTPDQELADARVQLPKNMGELPEIDFGKVITDSAGNVVLDESGQPVPKTLEQISEVQMIGGVPYIKMPPKLPPTPEDVRKLNAERIKRGQTAIPTTRGANAIMSLMRGYAEGLPALFKSAAAIKHLWDMSVNADLGAVARGEIPQLPKLEESWLWQAGQQIQEKINAGLPVNPTFQNEFWAAMIPQGVGSTAFFATIGAAGRQLGLPSLPVTMTAGATTQMGPMYDEAYLAGASREQLFAVAMAGLGLGATEAFPIERAFRRLDNVSGGFATRWLRSRLMRAPLREGLIGYGEEFAQEFLQSLGQDWVSRAVNPQHQGSVAEDFRQGLAGGAAGAAFSAFMATLGVQNMRARMRDSFAQRREEVKAQLESTGVPKEEVKTMMGLLQAREKQLIRQMENAIDESDRQAEKKVKEYKDLTGTEAVMVLKPESGAVIEIRNKEDYERIKAQLPADLDKTAGMPQNLEVTGTEDGIPEAPDQYKPIVPAQPIRGQQLPPAAPEQEAAPQPGGPSTPAPSAATPEGAPPLASVTVHDVGNSFQDKWLLQVPGGYMEVTFYDDRVFIDQVSVAPNFQRQGLASAMYQKLGEMMKERGIPGTAIDGNIQGDPNIISKLRAKAAEIAGEGDPSKGRYDLDLDEDTELSPEAGVIPESPAQPPAESTPQPTPPALPTEMGQPPLSPSQQGFQGWLDTVSPSEMPDAVSQYKNWVESVLPEELRRFAPSYLRAQEHHGQGVGDSDEMAAWALTEAQRIQEASTKPISIEDQLQRMPPENLEELQKNGVDDAELKLIIGRAFGSRGGWGNEDEAGPTVQYRGGPYPFFNIRTANEEIKLTGKALTDAYRKTFGIPEKAVKTAEAGAAAVEQQSTTAPAPTITQPAETEATTAQETTPTPPAPKLPAEEEKAPAFQQTLYRGRGASPEQIYGKEAVKEGRAVPVFGKAEYYAFNERDASTFGKVTKHEVTLQNPFMLDSDEKWFQLLKDADAPHLDNMGELFYTEPQGIAGDADKVQAYLKSLGHDGIVVKLDPYSDDTRRLSAMVGIEQVVKFTDAETSEASPDVTPESDGDLPQDFGEAPEIPPAGPESTGTEPQEADTPDIRLAKRVAEFLKWGSGIDRDTFFSFADEEYGGTRAEGKYGPSEAYDALELGINLYIQGLDDSGWVGADRETAHKIIKQLQDLQAAITSQTNRSGNKDLLQQFSTPPAYAYAIAWIANIKPGDVALEPSAGTGDIAMQAKKMGAEVHGNEIDPRRAALLEQVTPNVTTFDAEQIGNILHKKLQPTVVLMNPPFSRAGTRMGAKKVIGTDRKHIDAALSLLAPDGRLVAIVGAPLHGGETVGMAEWLTKIKNKYNVRANVQVGRDVYKGYGTTFPTRVLVIDNTGPTPENMTITGNVDNLDELIDISEGVRNERKRAPEPSIQTEPGPAGETDGEVSGTPPSGRPGTIRPVPPATGTGNAGGTSGKPTSAGPEKPGLPSEPSGDNVELGTGPSAQPTPPTGTGGVTEREHGQDSKEPERQGTRTGRGDTGREPAVQPGESAAEPTGPEPRTVTPEKKKLDENVIFDRYTPSRVTLKGAQPHPASVVESSTMAAVEFPKVDYVPDIPAALVESGDLSDVQLEFIAAAGANHEKFMPDEKRYGILLGDGTGMGKGRQLAGVILDNWRRGRKRAVWISKNKKLFDETVRDWKDLGQNEKQVHNISKFAGDENIDIDEGILYSTYDTLRSGSKNGRSRLTQIADWLSQGDKEFDGVIVFDEAHIMGSLGSERGIAARALQERFPKARIVYASATAATEIESLVFAQRLGLWGAGTPFASVEEFAAQIGSAGVSAMEATALSLKAMGRYMARSISFDDGTPEGRVEYDRAEHKLTEDQIMMYDRMAEAWQKVIHQIEASIKATHANSQARGRARANFWSAHQRFFNMMITSMQMPAVLERMEEDLAAGHSIVLQLTNTNEADQERAVADRSPEDDLDDFVINPFDTLINLVRDHFPTQAYEEYTGPNGTVRTRPAYTGGYIDGVPQGEPIQDAAAVAAKEALLDDLTSMNALMPESPLDMIVNMFGDDRVAEITGRKRRFTWQTQPDGSRKKVEQRRKGDLSNRAEIAAFQDDKKQILVFSEAGGTGASYHAARTAKNQRKRIHYLVQAGWRADAAIQGLGRTHRANQRQAPEYVLVNTDLSGQKRFISTIARRLAQLGALTKGQRQASGGGVFTAADNLESQEATDALRQLFRALFDGQIPDLTIDEFEAQTGLQLRNEKSGNLMPPERLPGVTQFLNRLLSMRVSEQNKTFEAFDILLKDIVEAKTADGTLDQGVETIKGSNIAKLQDLTVYRHQTGATARYVKLEVEKPTPKTSWEEARGYKALTKGFARNKRTGNIWQVEHTAVTETDKDGRVHGTYRMRGPGSIQYVRQANVTREKYEIMNEADAQVLWQQQFSAIPATRKVNHHMISGTVLPIWDRLPANSSKKIVRVQTADGEVVLGIDIHPNHIDDVLRNLGAEASGMDIDQVLQDILADRVRVQLTNGWWIERAQVQREKRLEIIGPSMAHNGQLEKAGAIIERVAFKYRYFIPTGDNMRAVWDAVTQNRPIAKVEEYSAAGPVGMAVPGPAPMTSKKMIGRAEVPVSIEQALEAAEAWLSQAQEAIDRIAMGEGTIADQMAVHMNPVIAKHLLNWINKQDPAVWLAERPYIDKVVQEVQDYLTSGKEYYEAQAQAEAQHYGPHVERMIDEVTRRKEGMELVEEEEESYSMASPPPVLPAPPTVAPGATYGPPPVINREDLVNRNEILAELANKLQVPIRYRRFRIRASGIYKPDKEVIRIKMAQDIGTAAHEIGHHLNKLMWGMSTAHALNWRPLAPYRTELEAIATKPRAGQSKLPEGFAEFIRMWITDPPAALRLAPRFHAFFESQLVQHQDIKDVLVQARTDYNRWLSQQGSANILSAISIESPEYSQLDWFSRFYTGVVNKLHPLELAVKAIMKGKALRTEDDPAALAQMLQGWAAKAEHFLNHGTFSKRLNRILGPGLREILEPVKDRLDDLRITAVALRALEKRGLQGIEVGITVADAHQTLREQGFDPSSLQTVLIPSTAPGTQMMPVYDPQSLQAMTPEAQLIKDTLDKLYKYQDDLLVYFRDAGMMSMDTYTKVKLLNQFFVPFHRLYEPGAGEQSAGGQPKGGKNTANLWMPVKKMAGSWRPIIDPLESIIRNTYTLINIAERNMVGQALARLAKVEGAGRWIEGPLPAKSIPHPFALDRIKDTLLTAGVDVDAIDLEQMATIFVPDPTPSIKENIATVFFDGKPQLYQLEPNLYKTMAALDQEAVDPLVRIASIPASLLRAGATGYNPEFATRNIMRDSVTAWLQTSIGFVPYWNTLTGLSHVLKKDAEFKEWLRSGGPHAAMVSMDREEVRKNLEDMMRGKMQYVLHHPLDALRILSEVSEAMTRVGVYTQARKKGMSIQTAGLASREGTLDFQRIGLWMRGANMTIPFLNAGIQDVDKFARVHKNNPKGALLKGATLALVSLIFYYLNKDDERFHELPRWQRDLFWMIPTKGIPGLRDATPFIPLPKPFLWGMVYGTVTERFAEYIDRKDPGAFNELMKSLASNTLPGLIPTIGKVPGELWFNLNTWTGQKIESDFQIDNFPPEYRKNWFTGDFASQMALGLAKIGIHVSPLRIEHAIFGTAGGTGRFLTKGVLDPIASVVTDDKSGEAPDVQLIDIPLFRVMAVRYPHGNLRSITTVEERWKEISRRYNSRKQDLKQHSLFGIEPLTSAEKKEYITLRSTVNAVQEYNREIHRITMDPKLSGETKRKQIEGTYEKILKLCQSALKKIKVRETDTELPKQFSSPPAIE